MRLSLESTEAVSSHDQIKIAVAMIIQKSIVVFQNMYCLIPWNCENTQFGLQGSPAAAFGYRPSSEFIVIDLNDLLARIWTAFSKIYRIFYFR